MGARGGWQPTAQVHHARERLPKGVSQIRTYVLHHKEVPVSSVMRKDRRASPLPGGSTCSRPLCAVR
jgi:hypothetical protein